MSTIVLSQSMEAAPPKEPLGKDDWKENYD